MILLFIYNEQVVTKQNQGQCALLVLRGDLTLQRLEFFNQKLKVSQPGDAYEQEADRVTEHVMRMPISDSSAPTTTAKEQGIDRKCSACEEKKEEEKNLNISRKPSSTSDLETTDEAANKINHVLSSSGSPLDSPTRQFFGKRLGYDFSNVRVHADGQAARAAQAAEARAFTVGRDIVFAPDEYQPSTAAGRHLIAHELTHVVQQTQSNPVGLSFISPTMLQRQSEDVGLPGGLPSSTTTPKEVSTDEPSGTDEPPAPLTEARPANVSRIVMSCIDKHMRMETATGDYVYKLIECSIPLGSYETQVTIGYAGDPGDPFIEDPSGEDFYLGFPIALGKFQMTYYVEPGQENPATLLRKQGSVHVDVVERVPVAEAAAPEPDRPDKPSPASCVIRLKDRVLVPRDSMNRNLFEPITMKPTVIWDHDIPLGSFGEVYVAASASGSLTGGFSASYGPGLLTDICLTHLIESESGSAPIEHPLLGPGSRADVTNFVIGGRARFSLPARAAIRLAAEGRLRIWGDYLRIIEIAAAEARLGADAEATLAGSINASVEVVARATRKEATLKDPIAGSLEVIIRNSTIDAVDLAAEIGLRGRAGFKFRVDLSTGFDVLGYNLWRQTWNLGRFDSGVSWSGGLRYSSNPGVHWDLGTLGVENEADQGLTEEEETLEASGSHEDAAEVEEEDIIEAILSETHAQVSTPDGLSEDTALPFDWYKPLDLYPPVLSIPNADDPKDVHRDAGPTSVRYHDNRGKTLYDEIGVADWPAARRTFEFFPYDARNTPEQARFNRLLDALGYDRSGTDAEHVWDVGLRGLDFDRFDNLWPASNQEQQLAGGRHHNQIRNYRATLGNLAGRWFVISRIRHPA